MGQSRDCNRLVTRSKKTLGSVDVCGRRLFGSLAVIESTGQQKVAINRAKDVGTKLFLRRNGINRFVIRQLLTNSCKAGAQRQAN
jgi:hypothetical protein